MDYPSRTVGLAFAAIFCIAVTACNEGGTGTSRIEILPEQAKWAPPDVDLVSLLASEPSECLREAATSSESDEIVLGRTAFRSPFLLGGQAARQGLSCNSCHTNGAINRHFHIEGLSDEPGTADVTNFHFSKTLGDQTFNPKPIPSLASLEDLVTPVQQARREKFVLRLVEQEFDGAPPPTAVKNALLKYVAVLDPEACMAATWSGKQMLQHRLAFIDQSFSLLDRSIYDDQMIRDFVIGALRNEFGRLNGRFPRSRKIRVELLKISQEIKAVSGGEHALERWMKLKPRLIRDYEHSLFNPDYVRAHARRPD